MGKLGDFLTGTKVLEEADSSINGKISVIKSVAYGTYIQVEGLTQSGGVVNSVWKSTLRKVKSQRSKVKSCLILGLGAGTAARLVKRFWPELKITGVEIDPVFVNLGKKYFGLGEMGIDIKIQDTSKFISQRSKVTRPRPSRDEVGKGQRYDLVLVDMYVGDKVPKKFETKKFVGQVKKLMDDKSIVVFNRLYYGEKRTLARKFGELLEQEFRQVIYHYPEANLMFICKK